MTKRRKPPLTDTAFEILLALAKEDLHGYAIMKSVEHRTKGRVRLRPGTLYRALARLLETGVVAEPENHPVPSDDERRRTYTLTPKGRRLAAAEAERLADQVKAARRLKLSESR